MSKIPGFVLDEDEFGFEGVIELATWRGFQSRNGAYGAQDSQSPSNGIFAIRTCGDMVVDEPKIEDYHVEAYNYLIEHQTETKEHILNTLKTEYPKLQELYGYEPEEKQEYMPDVSEVEDFKNLIGIANIHLLNVEKDGIGYVGFEFGCTWDDEHGLGIMTHKNRIIKIGGADASFLTWVAKADLE
ncbi:MAG: DUF6985 domain-containing protein [bacterium]